MLEATVRTNPNQDRERALAGALARLAFGAAPSGVLDQSVGPRHLAFLPPEVLELDLDDPGQRQFGDYELIEKLGQGGMGVVYRARQASLDRDVALKLLSAGPWASRDFIQRFRREAQSAARMQHPNIVAVFEIGSHEELNFFSMRLVQGQSLAHILNEHGPMAPRQAASLMRIIAEALDYAHRLGVLHLDLKPGNVLIDERGEPQVADFGLARRLDESLAADNDEVSGTPSYMAPEQAVANAGKLSPATDIWGLGAILYELLCGLPPFLGPTAQETLQRVVGEPVEPVRRQNARVPRDLDAICMKCLAKDPADRYTSARDLALDLAAFLDGRPVKVRPLNPAQKLGRWVRRHPELAAVTALLFVSLAAGLGAAALQWQRAEANAAASNERLWAGRHEAAIRLEQGGNGFEAASRLLLNIGEREQIGGAGSARIERGHLGVLLGQAVTLIDAMLIADANPLAVEISPDGRVLAVALNDFTVRWFDTRTLTEQGRVDLIDQPTSEGFLKRPALLRFVDNQRLRVTLEWYSLFASPQEGDSFLIDLGAGSLVAPPPEFADLTDATYSADGDYALLRNSSGAVQVWQVAPWKPLSALADGGTALAQPWLLGRKARYAARNLLTSRRFELLDVRDLTRPLPLLVPANSGFSAWTESGNGAWLALGDTESRVFVMDLSTHAIRVLPTPKGQDISWLAFSEDDAWLVACSLDGSVYAFDVASGTPLASGAMQTGFELRRAAISRAQRLVVAAGVGQTGLWRLPEPGPQSRGPGRLGTAPTVEAMAGYFAIGWSPATGLLATAGVEGQVRLWRLPQTPVLPARASRLTAGTLEFDGQRIVDVASNRLRIVSPDGDATTPWLTLRGVPGFAELVRGGDTVVVTVANELHAYDSNTLRPRFAPVSLAGTPQNLSTSGDGSAVVLSFGHAGEQGFEEHIEVRELRTGALRAGPVVTQGPLRQLEFSPDAHHVLAAGPRMGGTTVFDGASLASLGRFPHDPDAPVIGAAFAPGPGSLLLAQRADDQRRHQDELLEWAWSGTGVRARHALPMLRPVAVAAAPRGTFVMGSGYDQFDPGGPRAFRPERLARSTATVGFAASPDGRLLAHGFRHEVQLYDAETLAPVGPPLYADLAYQDSISRLAFSPDSQQLLARGVEGYWLRWRVGARTDGLAEIVELMAPLQQGATGTVPLRMPTPAERQRLRRGDMGSWRALEDRPRAPVARLVEGSPIPARAPDTDPLLLDLTRAYNIAPDANTNEKNNMIATQRFLGTGVQRLDGVDYDIRGSVQMGGPEGGPQVYSLVVPGIEVPPVPVAGFHVLMFAGHRSTEPDEREYARLRLHYQDGSSAVLPLRTRREVPGWTEKDGPVPFAWAYGDHLRVSGAPELIMISNPRLANPHPDRIVRTLDLESGDGTWNAPVFLAITVDPVTSNATPRSKRSVSRTGPPPGAQP